MKCRLNVTVIISPIIDCHDDQSTINVAGHYGLVVSAFVQALVKSGYAKLLLPSRTDLDLGDRAAVRAFFAVERPEFVVMAAARDARHMFRKRKKVMEASDE